MFFFSKVTWDMPLRQAPKGIRMLGTVQLEPKMRQNHPVDASGRLRRTPTSGNQGPMGGSQCFARRGKGWGNVLLYEGDEMCIAS